MTERCDVAVIGAGIVGTALAGALAAAGLRVMLAEARAPELEWTPGSTDLRVSAVTAASQQIFARLGAWEAMTALGVSPYQEMHVWDAGGSGEIHFDCADVGEPRLGHIIENRVIVRALLERVRAAAQVTWRCPAAVETLVLGPEDARLVLSDGTRWQAALVVAADGAGSRTRTLAGLATRGWRYDQKAVVAHVATEWPHRHTAWQRFLPDGPLAFLPLRDGRSSIVWSTAPEHADRLASMDAADFTAQLGAAFALRLGRVLETGPRAVFPLQLQHATRYVSGRLVLVGDAAHTIHPLAGQGVNLGLLDAAALAEVVTDAAAEGRDVGAQSVLRRYERWRKGDNLAMMVAMDGFKRLFGSELPPVAVIRNLGLRLADAAAPLKQLLVRQAMGLKGDLPRLARQPHL